MRTLRLSFCLLAATWLAAADRPDFSGTWQLNHSKSDAGAPAASTKKIEQDDKELRVTTTQGGNSTEVKLRLDGKENENKVSAKWEGAALVVRSRREMGGVKIQSEDRWTLDGKTLTIQTRVTGGHDMTMKLVYEKE